MTSIFHHLELISSKTYFLGDDERDMEAAKSAGCKQFLIRENDKLDDVIKTLLGD